MALTNMLVLMTFVTLTFAQIPTDSIEQTLGVKGTLFKEEGVFKITVPRTDVKVTVDKRVLSSFMGLSSWVSFISLDNGLMAVGDLMLFEVEVNPIMKTLLS